MTLTGLRVLIVEDEAIAAMMFQDRLENLGCEVVAVAARLADAAQQAQTAAIDFATLDINLAGQLSYPVASILRQRSILFLASALHSARAV
jgi:CheY-like chemotaxis protein